MPRITLDPATLSLLIRLAGDTAITLIGLFRALGRDDQAKALAAILDASDAEWATIKAKAEAALAGGEPVV